MINYTEVFEILPQPGLLIEAVGEKFTIRNANRSFLDLSLLKKKDCLDKSLVEISEELDISDSCIKILQRSLIECFDRQQKVALEPVKFGFKNQVNSENFGIYWSIEYIPVTPDPSSGNRLLLAIFTDISSRILANREYLFTLEKLDSNEERCRYFIDENSDGLFSLDEEGNFLTVNEGLLNLAQISEKDILSMNFLPFCADHHQSMAKDFFRRTLAGSKQEFQADFVSAKGRKVVLNVSLVPLKIKGEIKGVYGIARDVTEKLNAEQKAEISEENLRKSERKFKALVQEGSDIIAIVNKEGYYEFVSDSVYNILGKYPEDYLGKFAFDFMHDDDRDRVYNQFLQLLESRQILIEPFRIKNGNDEWCWIESKATNLLGDPNVQGIVVNSKDVTEAYLQKSEIEELNHRYHFVSEATEDLIYDWNLKNNNIIRNKVFEKNYGFAKEEKSKEPSNIWFDRIHDKDKYEVLNSFKKALEEPCQTKWTQEYRFQMKNGKLAFLIDRAYILRDSKGKATRVVGAVMDVTESREALIKIEKQNTLLKEIAWEHAHITRAPLARIKALIDTLQDSSFDEWSKQELIAMIRSSADELDDHLMEKIEKIERVYA